MSTTQTVQPRQPHGVPTGGQFATSAKNESGVTLSEPTPPSRAFEGSPEVFTAKYDDPKSKVEAFKTELDAAVAALAEDDNWKNYLDTMSRFHHYSATNQLLIHLQSGGRATRVASFRKWHEEFERTVNKGERALGIFAPLLVSAKDKDGEPIVDASGKPTKRVAGFKVVPVFDVAQTEGKPLPVLETELSEEPPDGFVDDMVSSAEVAGYTVEFRNMRSHASLTAQGWTDPAAKTIVVDADLTAGSRAATLAHELGHVYAGHCDPKNDGKYHVGHGGCRGRFEVEADSIAYALQRSNGVRPGQSTKLSAQYVAGWSRHDKGALKDSAEVVSKATRAILVSAPFRNLID